MKKKITVLIICLVVGLVAIFSGCTDSVKQDAISTDYSTSVSGNGGMTVVYGNYLYFINGLAGEAAENAFGKAVKGTICRVALKDGKPDGKAVVIVPKNVFGTDTTYGGIYIVNDYIYYASPNSDLDGSGNPKTAEGTIMRTKVDGTATERIAKFTDNATVFEVAGNNLVYIRDSYIYSIDLTSKKFVETKVEESTILAGYLMNDEYLFYAIYNGSSTNDYIVKAYPLAGGETKEILTSKLFDASEKTLYTVSLLSIVDTDKDNVTLFYTKTDNGINTPEVGVYSYTFAKNSFAYDKSKEIRYTNNTNSTTNLSFTKVYKAGNYYLALDTNRFDIFNKDGSRVKTQNIDDEEVNASVNVGSAVTYFDVEITSDGIYLWYINSNVVYRVKTIDKDGKYIDGNAQKIFSGSYDSTYVTLEKAGNVIYYFNSSISNNAYYYVIPEITDSTTNTAEGKVLGFITETDIIAAF